MNQPKIRIKVKDMGDMIAVLYPEKAPETVKNFLALAESGFFDGAAATPRISARRKPRL